MGSFTAGVLSRRILAEGDFVAGDFVVTFYLYSHLFILPSDLGPVPMYPLSEMPRKLNVVEFGVP